MPDLAPWNPTTAACLFVTEKQRRERNITTTAGYKFRSQSYFKGVFPMARNLVDSDNETSNDEEGASSTFFEF